MLSTNLENLKPILNLNELNSFKLSSVKKFERLNNQTAECILCDKNFDLNNEEDEKTYLAHLLAIHKFVIADVQLIGDFKRYVTYWKERLSSTKLEEVCFIIETNTKPNSDHNQKENFFLLSEELPEEKELREKLNIYKLERVIKQQEVERNDKNYKRNCLFCDELVGNNRSNLINHMSKEHNFNIGNPDNIVYFEEFYLKLKSRFDKFQCLFCDKIFYNTQVLKEHMRKKQHKCIDPKNKEFDMFYIINYLEYSKVWKDIKTQKDENDNDVFDDDREIDDWNDPVQTFFCLFCDNSFEEEREILDHMTNEHQFNLMGVISFNQLSFYNQVKLINYIRRQVYLKTCFICKESVDSMESLRQHLAENEHVKVFPSSELWDQPEYYFSTFEDDSLLCLLDDTAYDKDECKVKVIPEEYDIRINNDIVQNFEELKM